MEAVQKYKTYEKYKDSGVKWLNKIPQKWQIITVKRITSFHKQGYYTQQEYVDSGVRLARITDIDDKGNVNFKNMPCVNITLAEENSYKIEPGDFLFARSGTIGRFGVVRKYERAVFASYLIKFKFNNNVNIEFLKYALGSKYFKEGLLSTLHGGANQNINADNIKSQILFLPSLDEQQKIAAFLDRETSKLDLLIEKKERLIELLKEKRQAIITQAVTKGLDPNVLMKDSGIKWIGDMPNNWEVIKLKQVLKKGHEGIKIGPFGSSLKLDEMVETGYKVYGQEHVINDSFQIGNKYINDKKYKDLRAYTITPGDIVITMMGTIGKCKLVPEKIEPGIMDSHLIRVRVNRSLANPKFIAKIIDEANYIREMLNANSNGSIMNGLNSTKIKELIILLPPVKEQAEIYNFIQLKSAKIENLISKLENQITKIKEYRQALISAAVTGKIDVRDEV